MSLVAKALLVAFVFLFVPVILYDQFRAADQQKRELMTASVRGEGQIVAAALSPLLTAEGPPNLPEIGRELARFGNSLTTIKVLFGPAAGATGFFYVGTSAPLSNETLDAERAQLKSQGVLDQLAQNCSGTLPMAMRYTAS
ncbi:MAG TPA: sensor histidine kinase, partial [Stellaceae bacterium]|nr:sensor histidine kinase [Stellaceae bacterium]